MQREGQRVSRALPFLHIELASELPREAAYELDAEAVADARLGLGAAGRDADPVVLDHQASHTLAKIAEQDMDVAAAATGKGILDRVADRLGDDQRQRHRLIGIQFDLGRLDMELDPASLLLADRLEQLRAELLQERAHVEGLQLAFRIQIPVQRRQRPHPVARGGELGARLGLANAVGLQVQQRGDDLQVVLDPVVDLLDQQLLPGLRALQRRLMRGQAARRLGEGMRQLAQLDRHQAGIAGIIVAGMAPMGHGAGQPLQG